jgi:peptidoglycan/xylan/chitin deacetylase (PgdA/CDA1 family)
MYHYVRPKEKTLDLKINYLELRKFRNQIDFLKNKFNIISGEELIYCCKFKIPLPNKSCLLTFDDGYKDHIQYVLPELIKRNIKACFFISSAAILKKDILDVNAIQFIIAKCLDQNLLINELDFLCAKFGIKNVNFKYFLTKNTLKDRFDDKKITYIKSLLQYFLPINIRKKIINIMYKKYVKINKKQLHKNLYLNMTDIKTLLNNKMYIGSHGHDHLWLNYLKKEEQEKDIDLSLNFLKKIGSPTNNWIMSYPYGAYNKTTISILKKKKCIIGITAKPRIADLNNNLLQLSRFDTKDFVN